MRGQRPIAVEGSVRQSGRMISGDAPATLGALQGWFLLTILLTHLLTRHTTRYHGRYDSGLLGGRVVLIAYLIAWNNTNGDPHVVGRLAGSNLLWGRDYLLASSPRFVPATVLDWQNRYAKLNLDVHGGVGEWLIPPDCKSGARKGYVGSNPTPSTRYP